MPLIGSRSLQQPILGRRRREHTSPTPAPKDKPRSPHLCRQSSWNAGRNLGWAQRGRWCSLQLRPRKQTQQWVLQCLLRLMQLYWVFGGECSWRYIEGNAVMLRGVDFSGARGLCWMPLPSWPRLGGPPEMDSISENNSHCFHQPQRAKYILQFWCYRI